MIFKFILLIDASSTSCEIALSEMPQSPVDIMSTLVQVMAWCRQATSHYLNQCWPSSMCRHMASLGHNELTHYISSHPKTLGTVHNKISNQASCWTFEGCLEISWTVYHRGDLKCAEPWGVTSNFTFSLPAFLGTDSLGWNHFLSNQSVSHCPLWWDSHPQNYEDNTRLFLASCCSSTVQGGGEIPG